MRALSSRNTQSNIVLRNEIDKIRLLFRKDRESYLCFYRILGFYPRNIQLYEQALLHKSTSVRSDKGRPLNNERLEFLGDAILDAIVGDIVYKRFEGKREGFLTNTRSKIVQRETLNRVAVEIGLDKLIKYTTRQSSHNSYMCGNAFEALIGAIYLDGGFASAKEYIHRFILNDIEHKQLFYDSKTILQEIIQSRQDGELSYEILKEEGPDHNKSFEVRALVGDQEIGRGKGRTKKAAEQLAAYNGILKLKAGETCI